MLSKVGNSPPHSASTIFIGEPCISGEAMLPRKRVRTAWNGTGQW